MKLCLLMIRHNLGLFKKKTHKAKLEVSWYNSKCSAAHFKYYVLIKTHIIPGWPNYKRKISHWISVRWLGMQ